MICDKCSGDRILSITGKTSDLFNAEFKNASYDGYVPGDLGIGEGDMIEIDVCLDCGKLQGILNANDPNFYNEAATIYEAVNSY